MCNYFKSCINAVNGYWSDFTLYTVFACTAFIVGVTIF